MMRLPQPLLDAAEAKSLWYELQKAKERALTEEAILKRAAPAAAPVIMPPIPFEETNAGKLTERERAAARGGAVPKLNIREINDEVRERARDRQEDLDSLWHSVDKMLRKPGR